MMLVTFSGLSRIPPVHTWNSNTIAASATTMPDWRMCDIRNDDTRWRNPGGVGLAGCGCASVVCEACSTVVVTLGTSFHHVPHERLLRRVSLRHLAGELALTQGIDAIANANQLRQFRRDDQHRFSTGGQFVDDRVDLVFGADVDAAGRLVENEYVGVGEQ